MTGPDRGGISVVVPVLNDAVPLRRLLDDLHGTGFEVVVVDGGSDDDSRDVAVRADRVLSGPRGRGMQMAVGAAAAKGEWLWFLHADARLPDEAVASLIAGLDQPGWGFFAVRLDGESKAYRMIERAMFLRSAATGIATGDQGIFVHRDLLGAVGGVPAQPLFEDVEISRRLRRLAQPRCLRDPLGTSSRRWQRDGVLRTVLIMWWLRIRYSLGADPRELARQYYG